MKQKTVKRLPSEIAINMYLEKMMILQQSELPYVNKFNYFDEQYPCHIYFIGKRPRALIDKDSFKVTDTSIEITFNIQMENEFHQLPLTLPKTGLKGPKIELKTNFPYNSFDIYDNGEFVFGAKVSPFLQTVLRGPDYYDFLDFEVLYIGQSYGVDGARTAPERLQSHSTLQGIYAKAISNNPDCEIWLALASFSQYNIMMFDGRTKFSDQEKAKDKKRFQHVYSTLMGEGINEQQKINFTEAALIRYFEPPYNKIYKDTFPNPAHSTYSQCYELDINSICIELQTSDLVNCQFFSSTIPKAPWHMKDFQLHSKEERRSMFDFAL